LDFGIWDWWLVANVGLVNVVALGKSYLEHSHDSAVLQEIKTLEERLKLIDDGDV
jgi:hypothetical protein